MKEIDGVKCDGKPEGDLPHHQIYSNDGFCFKQNTKKTDKKHSTVRWLLFVSWCFIDFFSFGLCVHDAHNSTASYLPNVWMQFSECAAPSCETTLINTLTWVHRVRKKSVWDFIYGNSVYDAVTATITVAADDDNALQVFINSWYDSFCFNFLHPDHVHPPFCTLSSGRSGRTYTAWHYVHYNQHFSRQKPFGKVKKSKRSKIEIEKKSVGTK